MPNSPEPEKPAPFPAHKLACLRQERGLTQTALAGQIGVSRQFFNQMEAGRVLPNVVIALRLATVLGSTVEELFGATAAAEATGIPVTQADPRLEAGARLWLGRVGGSWIAHAADTAGTLAAGFAPADAVLEGPGRARMLAALPAPTSNLLIAGCDPALALLQPAAGSTAGGRWHWIDCGSGRALDLLAAGQVHVAGIHYSGTNGAGNLAELRLRGLGARMSLVQFTRWEQGWLVRRGVGAKFFGCTALATGKWRLANRADSAAARHWLDRELARAKIDPRRIPGYDVPLASATDGAQAVAGGRADVTVGPQALAMAHGLDFVPAEAVDFDLVAPATWWRSDRGRTLKSRIAELAGTGVLTGLPGYVPTQSGIERPKRQSRR